MLIYDRFQEMLYLYEDVLFILVVALTTFPLMLAFYLVIVPAVVILLRRFARPLQDSRAGMRQQNEQVNAAVKEMLEMEGLTRAHGLEKTEFRKILTKVRGAQQAALVYDRKTVGINNITYGGFQGLRLLSLSFAALLTAGGSDSEASIIIRRIFLSPFPETLRRKILRCFIHSSAPLSDRAARCIFCIGGRPPGS